MAFMLGLRLIIIINNRNPFGLFHIYFGLCFLASIKEIDDMFRLNGATFKGQSVKTMPSEGFQVYLYITSG